MLFYLHYHLCIRVSMVLLAWKLVTVEGKLHLQQPMEAKLASHQLLLVLLAEMPMVALTCTVKDLRPHHRYWREQRQNFDQNSLFVLACGVCLIRQLQPSSLCAYCWKAQGFQMVQGFASHLLNFLCF